MAVYEPISFHSSEDPIIIENGNFAWDRANEEPGAEVQPPTLQNINLRVKEGTLVAIVGSVGAGKSSLVSALCGEMDKISGRVNTKVSFPEEQVTSCEELKVEVVFIVPCLSRL